MRDISYMITVVIKITYIQDQYKIVTFFLLFAGGDLAALGSLKLPRIDLVCLNDDCGTSYDHRVALRRHTNLSTANAIGNELSHLQRTS